MLENYSGFQTKNADRVRAVLFDEFGATHFNLPNGNRTFSVNLRWCKRDDITLVSAVCDDGIDVKYAPVSCVRQYFELDPVARLRFGFGQRTMDLLSSSPPIVVPARLPLRVESATHHNLMVLRIEQHALNRQVECMLAETIAGDVTFEPSTRQVGTGHQLMRQAVIQFAAEIDFLGPSTPSLARAELEQALVIKFLLFNAHNFSQRLSAQEDRPSLSQLRRAEDYLEANWDKPFDMEALVKVTQLSARTIFRQFKAIRGVTPRDFVKAIRLRHVRRILQNAPPGASVMAIAMACGFQSLGHFSHEYRLAFGERPSETLRGTSPSAKN